MKNLKTGKKLLSLVLAVTMAVVSLCSCGADTKADEELLDITKDGVKLILDRKISKLAKISTSDFDDAKKDWAEDLDFSPSGSYTSEERVVFEAISDTIDYSIDEDSVESSNKYGEGKVRVEFTIVDYAPLMDDVEAMNDSDSFIDAFSSCDDKTIELWFDFEKEGDSWLISNTEEILNELFSFREERFIFVPDLSRSSFDLEWYGCSDYSNNIYSNPYTINLELYFYDNSDTSQIYFTVAYNGDYIYTSQRGIYDAYFSVTDPGAPVDPGRGCLAQGEYTISFYDGNDRFIAEDTCTVCTFEPGPADYINWYYENEDWGIYALFNDTFGIDPDLDLAEAGGYGDDYFYTVTYNGELVYTSSEGSFMGYYYAEDQDPDSYYLDAGFYEVSFYRCDSSELVVTAYAIVMRDNEGPDGTYLGAFLGHNVTGRGLSADMYNDFESAYWYSTDPASPAEGMVFDSADSLTYRIPVSQDYGTLLYDFTYSDDGDANEAYADTIQSSNAATVQTDADGSLYYEFTFDGTVDAGYYRITVLADNGIDFSLFSVCQVQN